MSLNMDDGPELNITPLVDVMLVLLAILMITAPVVVYEEQITLPSGSKSTQTKDNALLEIRVDKNKNVYIKKNKYTMNDFSDNFLLMSKSYDKKTPVYIRADKELQYQDVMFILKAVKEAGLLKVSLVTDG